jgi:hypothetical protein
MKNQLTSNAVKYGLIGGLILITIHIASWSMGGAATYTKVVAIDNFVPYIFGLIIFAGLQERKLNGGILKFADALKFAFLSYVIVALIEAVGNYVLFNVLDKDLTAKVIEISKEKMMSMMEKLGGSEEQMKEAMAKVDKEAKETSLKNIVLGTGMNLIWYFIKALIIALIIKKEAKPEDNFAV